MLTETRTRSPELALQLFEAFCDWYSSDSDFTVHRTESGDTQNTERDIVYIFEETLKEFGYCYKKASSQKPYDFRVCLDQSIMDTENEWFKHQRHLVNSKEYDTLDLTNDLLLLELKKSQTGSVILNDTVPQPDSFYVIMNLKKRKAKSEIGLWRGQDVIDALEKKMADCNAESTDIYEYQEEVMNLRAKYGKAFYPRLNLSFKYKDLPSAVGKFSLGAKRLNTTKKTVE